MQTDEIFPDQTPPDCFSLADLQALQSFEAQLLFDVNYYLWLNNTDPGAAPYRFLYCVELVFEQRGTLLLSSGEDSTAIRLISVDSLVKTARELQTLHRQISIQRVSAGVLPLWQPLLGQTLQGVRLSRNENELYLNDAMVLDFGAQQILLQLSPKEGLEIGAYN